MYIDVHRCTCTHRYGIILLKFLHTKMRAVYVYGMALIVSLLVVCRLMVGHQIVIFRSEQLPDLVSPGQNKYKLPESWSKTSNGYTVDCCSGSPNTRYWPQQSNIKSEEFTLDTLLGMHEDAKERQSSFINIFQKRTWGGSKPNAVVLSASGGGSTLGSTGLVRQTLDCVINDVKYALKKKVLRVLDIPCGDLRWMSVFLHVRNRTDIEYTGMDIVPDIIKHHKKTYSDQPWTFRVHDIVAESLTDSYDLVFSRDMTQHLTIADTLRVVQHFSESGSHFAMMTTYPSTTNNERELKLGRNGRFHSQDLERPPYRLTPPICVRDEKRKGGAEYSALWRLPMK